MEIVGYTDRLSAPAGESVRFMVSCQAPSYRADIVRLIHGDTNPRGPGFKEEPIDSTVAGDYAGRYQAIHSGSYVVVPDHPLLRLAAGFTIQAWISPTTPEKGAQAIVSKLTADGTGYGLFIGDDAQLELVLGDEQRIQRLRSGVGLRRGEWYFVAAAFDPATGTARVHQVPVAGRSGEGSGVVVEQTTEVLRPGENDLPLTIAASLLSGGPPAGANYNGKVDRPRIFDRALTESDVDALRRGAGPHAFGGALAAAWDFAADISSSRVSDVSANRLHGRTVNIPARGMTGYNWTGYETNFTQAPDEYGAIHFHDDDLDDAGWETDFELTVPEEMQSGVYAARLRTDDAEDYVPFYVRPRAGRPKAPVAFLAPTNSYLAYGDEQIMSNTESLRFIGAEIGEYPSTPQDRYIVDNDLLSMYDLHSDGSGVCYSSRLRPLVNMRPKYIMPTSVAKGIDSPHQFSADLHLLDWMEAKGHRYDVFTDEDLHFDGADLLAPYKVIVTGSHPEYWSTQMLVAMDAYLDQGGRLMYLGGNGFYWVTSFDPDRPHMIEIRRWGGTQSWRAEPGEFHHSTTGELGGLWRSRNRAPQKMLGVGFTSQGLGGGRPYRRGAGSFDPRAAFIFEGIGEDELIGDFESLVWVYGAGGFEIDRLDHDLGSPHHAMLLASSTGFSDDYQHVIEEVLNSGSPEGGTENPLVRADMVYLIGPKDGAVFSVGSISWCGTLSNNDYDNSVSRVTDNVLSMFASDGPLP